MNSYNNEEKFDLLVCYIKSERNSEGALQMYLHEYPERIQPNKKIFRRLVSNLMNFGSFEQSRKKHYDINNDQRNQAIVNVVNDNPSGSVRHFSHETGVPKSTLHRVIIDLKFHAYKPKIVQGLVENDYPRRRAFCEWYLTQIEQDNNFRLEIVWSDESRVTNCGIFNKHNRHYWAVENPFLREERRFQTRFGTNVWCGILGKLLVELKKTFNYIGFF
jgi:hypothetical protein